MSRPIKLSSESIDKLVEQFKAMIAKTKMFDGEFSFKQKFSFENNYKATLVFEPVAYLKMLNLVFAFDSEVAWHGVARRSEENDSVFYIDDILVYPQTVSGATVNTDQEEYQTWLYKLDDYTFNNLRFQGHSHVNMGVSPSSVDLSHQERILDQLDDDMFYIFMIINKKFESFIKIFDLKNNILFEKSDIEMFINDADYDNEAFIKEAKDLVTKSTTTYYGSSKYIGKSIKENDSFFDSFLAKHYGDFDD